MRGLIVVFVLANLGGCAEKKDPSTSTAGSGGSATAPVTEKAAPVTPPPSPSPAPDESDDGASEVAALVVHDVGSKALGSQTIEASCVSVTIMPAGKWTVAAAHLDNCGDKTARSILWLYKRSGDAGKWNEDYVGQPPKCWKGVPPDLIEAVTKATKIHSC